MAGGESASMTSLAALRTTAVALAASLAACGPETRVVHAKHEDGSTASQTREVRGPDGEWVADGPFLAWHPDGTLRAEGGFRGGEQHGPWRQWHANGRLGSEGSWDAGERHGEWKLWYESGAPMTAGTYRHGEQVGRWTLWFPDGVAKSEGSLLGGRREGVWVERAPGGAVDDLATGIYEDGEKIGDWFVDGERVFRWGDGQVQERSLWKDGLREGPCARYWGGGARSEEGAYSRGRRTGPWRFWNIDGTLDGERTGTYDAGRRIGGLAGGTEVGG